MQDVLGRILVSWNWQDLVMDNPLGFDFSDHLNHPSRRSDPLAVGKAC